MHVNVYLHEHTLSMFSSLKLILMLVHTDTNGSVRSSLNILFSLLTFFFKQAMWSVYEKSVILIENTPFLDLIFRSVASL